MTGPLAPRVVVAADAADYKKGARLCRGLCRRVVSPQGKRLTMICASLVLLQIMFAVHRFAQGATAPAALRVVDCPSGNAYKVSVTGFTFSIIRYDKHYGNQPPPVAFSPLWCLTAPPSRPAGKRVTRFSGRFAPLRIVFPCHRGAVGQ